MKLKNITPEEYEKFEKLFKGANKVLNVETTITNFVSAYKAYQGAVNNALEKGYGPLALSNLMKVYKNIAKPFVEKQAEYLESGRNPDAIHKTLEAILENVYNLLDDEAKDYFDEIDLSKDIEYIDYCNNLYNRKYDGYYDNKDFMEEENENIKFARLSRDRNTNFKKLFTDILDNEDPYYKASIKQFYNKDEVTPGDRAAYAGHILANDGKVMIDTHTVLKTKYNEMGFFKKWFTREGYHTRNAMNEIKSTLEFVSKKVNFTNGLSVKDFLNQRTMDKVGKIPGPEAGKFYEIPDTNKHDRNQIEISDEELLGAEHDDKVVKIMDEGSKELAKVVGIDAPDPERIDLDNEIEL